MSTDDYLLDQVERSQRSRTLDRRERRSHRRHLYLLSVLALIAAVVIVAPSLISHSSIGRGLVARTIGSYGLDATVDSMRIGWVTPLRITGLTVQGEAGSSISVQQFDLDMTITDLIRSSFGDLGQVTARGIDLACTMRDGRCSLEDDLSLLWEPGQQQTSPSGSIKLQDITVSVSDESSGEVWRVSQTSADVDLLSDRIQGSFAGVLTEPGGSGGSLQGTIEFLPSPSREQQSAQWRLELQSESLPLSVVSLIRRRFPLPLPRSRLRFMGTRPERSWSWATLTAQSKRQSVS